MTTYSIPVYKVALVKDGSIKLEERPQLRSSGDAYNILKEWFLDADRESFVVLMLNAKNRVIGINEVSVGSLTSSLVHPREVFKPLILHNAVAFIMGHNHPSGDPTPSQEDLALTRRLREIGEVMAIRALDHIIVGDGKYISFVDDGYWDK
jgi:DNA repair protein RadC